MSIDRLAERLNFSDDTYDSAVENLSLAIEQMNLAVGELDKVQITSALQPEQLALQYILKAEANINRTNISMQQGGGGGGGVRRSKSARILESFLKWKWASWRTAMKRQLRREALSRISRNRQTGRARAASGGFDPGTAQSGAARRPDD